MNYIQKYFLILFVVCLYTASGYAELFIWTDENGVKHYSNESPGRTSTNVKVEKEIISPQPEPSTDKKTYTKDSETYPVNKYKKSTNQSYKMEQARKEQEKKRAESYAKQKAKKSDRIKEEIEFEETLIRVDGINLRSTQSNQPGSKYYRNQKKQMRKDNIIRKAKINNLKEQLKDLEEETREK